MCEVLTWLVAACIFNFWSYVLYASVPFKGPNHRFKLYFGMHSYSFLYS